MTFNINEIMASALSQEWAKAPLEKQLEDDSYTKRYTVEERKKLYDIMQDEAQKLSDYRIDVDLDSQWGYAMPLDQFVKEFESNAYPVIKYFFSEAFKLFEDTLDNMPLFINDKDWRTRVVAKWRLEIGK